MVGKTMRKKTQRETQKTLGWGY